jgi:hypothetical protein
VGVGAGNGAVIVGAVYGQVLKTVVYNNRTDVANAPRCFPANTPILLPDHSEKPISDIRVGDAVLAYDGFGALAPRKVSRLYRNVTTEWLELSFADAAGQPQTLTVTPGHRFLNEHGRFERIEDIARRSGRIINAEGRMLAFTSKRLTHDASTAGLYEQATGMLSPEAGGLALQSQPVEARVPQTSCRGQGFSSCFLT